MKKIAVSIVLMLSVLLSSCEDAKQKYWMKLSDGSEIVVEYKVCAPNGLGVECWSKGGKGLNLPDAFYEVSEFKRID